MRKLLLPLLGVVVLAAAGAAAQAAGTAAAASQTVTISHTGYTPTAVSITTGDTVVFKNSDTVAHTVDFKSTTGMHCSAAVPLAVPAAQSASCTFSTAGSFKFSDATGKGKNFHGTITVSPPLVSSLTVTPKSVVYGGKSTLAGKLASGQAGQSVQVLGQACGDTKATALATVTTTTGGAFSYQAQPSKHTTYTLKNKGLTAVAGLSVKPLLQLRRAGRHHFRLQISAAQSFVGKVATFQRHAHKRWVKVKRITLKTSAAGTAPTVITSAKFRSGIKTRQRVRVSLGPKQVGACYVAGHSNTVRS